MRPSANRTNATAKGTVRPEATQIYGDGIPPCAKMRPSNVDDSASLRRILTALLEINDALAVVFPAYPGPAQPS